MKTKNTFQTILSYFIPIFLELLLINLLTSIDTLMLKEYDMLCVNAVGTASSTLQLLMILIIISANGVAITVGQFLGGKKESDAKEVLSQGVFFNFILGILLFLVFFFFAGPLLHLVNTKESFFDYAKQYIQIYSFALPFQAVTQVINSNFRAYGKPFYMTIVSIASNLINVLFNYLLIFGIGFFPEMGIRGAALATVISLVFKTFCGIILEITILKCHIIPRKIQPKILWSIIKIGGPSALETAAYTLCSFILMAALNTLTDQEIGSRVFINLVLGYIYMFSSSLSASNSILVARYVGAHDYQAAKRLTLKTTAVGIAVVVTLVAFLNIFGRWLFGLVVGSEHPEYVDIIVKVIPLAFLLEIGRAINLIVIGAQKSAGDVLFPLILGIISMSIVMAGGAWLFSVTFGFALTGIILAQALDEFIRGIVSMIRWLSNSWMNHSLVKDEPEANPSEC